jgi:hypothetical protein
MTAATITGPDAFRIAQRKARFGHNDWIWWRDAAGSYAARKTPEAVKAMLLAVGTKGRWSLICADSGIPMKGFWWLGINALAQAKRGW